MFSATWDDEKSVIYLLVLLVRHGQNNYFFGHTKLEKIRYVNNLQKFRKFTVSPISRLGNIKGSVIKSLKMSLYKSGQVRDISELNVSFHDDNFRVKFF